MESKFPTSYIFEFLYKTAFEPFLSSRDTHYASVVPFAVQHKTVVMANREGSVVHVFLSGFVIDKDYVVCEVLYKESETLYRPHLVPFKYAQHIRGAKVWKTLAIIKIKLCAMTGSDVQFRKQRQVGQLESWYFNSISEPGLQSVATRKLQPKSTKKIASNTTIFHLVVQWVSWAE